MTVMSEHQARIDFTPSLVGGWEQEHSGHTREFGFEIWWGRCSVCSRSHEWYGSQPTNLHCDLCTCPVCAKKRHKDRVKEARADRRRQRAKKRATRRLAKINYQHLEDGEFITIAKAWEMMALQSKYGEAFRDLLTDWEQEQFRNWPWYATGRGAL